MKFRIYVYNRQYKKNYEAIAGNSNTDNKPTETTNNNIVLNELTIAI